MIDPMENKRLFQNNLGDTPDSTLDGYVESVNVYDTGTVSVNVRWHTCGAERDVTKSYEFSRDDWVHGATFVHRLDIGYSF